MFARVRLSSRCRAICSVTDGFRYGEHAQWSHVPAMTNDDKSLILPACDRRRKCRRREALSRMCGCIIHMSRRRVPAAMPQAGEPAAGGRCTRTGLRRAAAAVVPGGTDVVAVRISAPGWEAAVLDGLQVSPSLCRSSSSEQGSPSHSKTEVL